MSRTLTASLLGAFVLLLTPTPSDALIIADSVADFNAAKADSLMLQGEYNWYYGYYLTNGDHTSFTTNDGAGGALDIFWGSTVQWWWTMVPKGANPYWADPYATFPKLTDQSACPGVDGNTPVWGKWAVRRWIAEFADTVLISGTVQRINAGGVDGAAARFFLNGVEVASEAIIMGASDLTPKQYAFSLPINVGDILDFAVDDLGYGDFQDYTIFTVQVDSPLAPEPATIGVLVLGAISLLLRRKRD